MIPSPTGKQSWTFLIYTCCNTLARTVGHQHLLRLPLNLWPIAPLPISARIRSSTSANAPHPWLPRLPQAPGEQTCGMAGGNGEEWRRFGPC